MEPALVGGAVEPALVGGAAAPDALVGGAAAAAPLEGGAAAAPLEGGAHRALAMWRSAIKEVMSRNLSHTQSYAYACFVAKPFPAAALRRME